jgi:hypothetical protein
MGFRLGAFILSVVLAPSRIHAASSYAADLNELDVEIGVDQRVLDEPPDDASHLVAR